MKLGLASDLHLDFADMNPEFFEWRGNILLLAGDLAEEDFLRKHGHMFMDQVSNMATWVLVIVGNHEFYGSELDTAEDHLDLFFEQWPNIILLRNNSFKYENVEIFGATMWTDYHDSPIAAITAATHLNDFTQIRVKSKNYRKIIPLDILHAHQKAKNALLDFLAKKNDTIKVVMTHHAPSMQSIPDRFKYQHELNKAYCNRFDELIESNSQIKVCVHGHTHDYFDYNIGETRVICNSRGYPDERPSYLLPYQPMSFYL